MNFHPQPPAKPLAARQMETSPPPLPPGVLGSGILRVLAPLMVAIAATLARADQNPAAPDAAPPAAKTALVMGNATYDNSKLNLDNALNDAKAVSAMLEKCGFKVILVEDADLKKMGDAVTEFRSKLVAGGVAAFYFSGHGMEIAGENFLIPRDADLAKLQGDRAAAPATQALPASTITTAMENAGGSMNIIILDCCRDNPLAPKGRNNADNGGLAKMDAPPESMIVFAAAPGKTALDGPEGKHSPFCDALLAELPKPGVPIEQAFKQVTNRVVEATRNMGDGPQHPWRATNLTSDFVLVPQPGADAGDRETVHAVISVKSALDNQPAPGHEVAILRKGPDGKHETLTRKKSDNNGRAEFQITLSKEELAASYMARVTTDAGETTIDLPDFAKSGTWHLLLQSPSQGGSTAYSFDASEVEPGMLPAGWKGDNQVGRRDVGIPVLRSGSRGAFTINSSPLHLKGDFFVNLGAFIPPGTYGGGISMSLVDTAGKPLTLGIKSNSSSRSGTTWEVSMNTTEPVRWSAGFGPKIIRVERKGETLSVTVNGPHQKAFIQRIDSTLAFSRIDLQLATPDICLTGMTCGALPDANPATQAEDGAKTARKSPPVPAWIRSGKEVMGEWTQWRSSGIPLGQTFSFEIPVTLPDQKARSGYRYINLTLLGSNGSRPLPLGLTLRMSTREAEWHAQWPGLDETRNDFPHTAKARPTTATLSVTRNGEVFIVSINGKAMGTLRAPGYGTFDGLAFDVFNSGCKPGKVTMSK